MKVIAQQNAEVTVVSLVGSLDTLTAEEVTQFLSDQIKQKHLSLVLDLSQVDYVSSAGLRVLLGTVKEARRQGGDLRLAAISRPIMGVLEMAGFTSILKYYESVETAVGSFTG